MISPEKDLEISFTYKQGIIGISWSDEKYLNTHIAETQNIAIVSLEILKAILKRPKSIGCHFTKETM